MAKYGPRPRGDMERVVEKITKTDTCWLWTGAKNVGGYPVFRQRVDSVRRMTMVHRFMYEQHVRPLVDGETIDHLCRVRHCVNPAHLDPCSSAENSRRSPYTIGSINSRKTHCPAGHPLSGSNLLQYGGRRCKICTYQRNRIAARARRTKAAE